MQKTLTLLLLCALFSCVPSRKQPQIKGAIYREPELYIYDPGQRTLVNFLDSFYITMPDMGRPEPIQEPFRVKL